jgi:hypothetical protein
MNSQYTYIRYKPKYIQIAGACNISTDANKCQCKIVIGDDNRKYISKPDKNNVYHWIKIKLPSECNTADEYFSQSVRFPKYDIDDLLKKLKLVKKELLKSQIYLIHVGWKNVYESFDDASVEAVEKFLKKIELLNPDANNIEASLIFYTDYLLFSSPRAGKMPIVTAVLEKHKKIVNDVFQKYFGKSYKEKKNKKKMAFIKLNKLKK